MKKRAVAVGIGQYADRAAITASPFAHQDAEEVRAALRRSGEFGQPAPRVSRSSGGDSRLQPLGPWAFREKAPERGHDAQSTMALTSWGGREQNRVSLAA